MVGISSKGPCACHIPVMQCCGSAAFTAWAAGPLHMSDVNLSCKVERQPF